MLWSLTKALFFFALVATLSWGATFLSHSDGSIRITMLGKELTLGPLQGVIAAIVVFILMWVMLRIAGLLTAVLRFLTGDETALSRHFDRNRERRGTRALIEAVVAEAAGEHRVALARAGKAQKLLGRNGASDAITAEAALALGERARAEAAYKALLQDDASRFAGITGLMKMKLQDGDRDTAMKLARKALDLKPDHGTTRDALLQLQTAQGDWGGARATLEARKRAGDLPKDVWKRRDAVLALQEAIATQHDDGPASDAHHRQAMQVARNSPDLVPAVAMAARACIARGDLREASRMLGKAWERQPHPDLAAAFAELAPNESPQARITRFEQLVRPNPGHPESRMLMAELQIANGDFVAARRALGDLLDTAPTARVLTIMAAIERGQGADDAIVRGWLARALTAPRGPQWVCDSCQAIHAHWEPLCHSCKGLDTLSWREPLERSGPSATQTEMLPILVGQPHDDRDPQADHDTIVDDIIIDANTTADGADAFDGQRKKGAF